MVSLSLNSGSAPSLIIAIPTTPIKTATAIEITTQISATRLETLTLSGFSIAINLKRICGIPK